MKSEITNKTIAIFSANYLPNIGGIEFYTNNLAKALAKQGCRVIVVTNNTFSLSSQEIDECGVEIVRLPCKNYLGGRFPVANRSSEFKRLLSWLGRQGVDCVVVNARFYPHSLLGIDFAESQGIKPILIDHGSAHLTLGSPVLDIPVQTVEHAFTWRVKRHDVDFYAVSQAGVKWLTHFGIEAKGVLNNSIDAAAFRASASDRNFRNELDLPPESFVVSFTGRYIPEKGVLALAEAARLLESCGVEFLLAGDGPLRERLEQAGARNLHLLGKISASDVAALLQQSDTFCLPSRSEGFSSSLLEAAACGTVPLITNVGGVAELMPDESYGVILDEASGEEIAAKINVLLVDRDSVREMGEKVQRRVEELFSWQRTAQLTLDACAKANPET